MSATVQPHVIPEILRVGVVPKVFYEVVFGVTVVVANLHSRIRFFPQKGHRYKLMNFLGSVVLSRAKVDHEMTAFRSRRF